MKENYMVGILVIVICLGGIALAKLILPPIFGTSVIIFFFSFIILINIVIGIAGIPQLIREMK